jgi:type VI secretion system protein ImpJ
MTGALSPLIWSEGMHLAPHHFQLQRRYFENSLTFAAQWLGPGWYGLLGAELDAEALRNGTVSLVHARGVMPDGLPFHFPDSDPLPPPRDVRAAFSPTEHALLVSLAIPPYRAGARNAAGEGEAAAVRYVAARHAQRDENTGVDEQTIQLGHKNFTLALGSEAPADSILLPLARVRRSGAGHFEYDPEFIPPCLQIGASGTLLDLVQRLVEMLESKADSITGAKADGQAGRYASQEIESFWLTHALNAALAPLRHHLASRRTSPEQLFTDLASLAGALCTFSLDAHPRDLPVYQHADPTTCFREIERRIREGLTAVVSKSAIRIALVPAGNALHMGEVADPRCLGPSQWIFGVASSLPAPRLAAEAPRLLKLCSGAHIARLVQESLPGLALEHLPVPPSGIAQRIGYQYFLIRLDGPCWKAIQMNRNIGAYAPDSLAVSDMEIEVVLP